MEGKLTIELDDGMVVSELVFGLNHAKHVLDCWASGRCGGAYQAASGDMRSCARPIGHKGGCAHMETWEDRGIGADQLQDLDRDARATGPDWVQAERAREDDLGGRERLGGAS